MQKLMGLNREISNPELSLSRLVYKSLRASKMKFRFESTQI